MAIHNHAGQTGSDENASNPTRIDAGHSRRRFLQLLAIAGAGAILPAHELLSQEAAGGAKGRIDVHHHLLPPFYVKIMQPDIIASGRPLQAWSPEMSLDVMDKNGIATAILSPQNHLVADSLSDKSDRARMLARQHNEYAAQLVKDHPGKFGAYAAIPLPDQDASVKEIAYAFDTLHLDGVALWTSYRDQWPGDPAFAAAFEEMNRRKAVVFFHPAAPLCCRKLLPGVGENVEEYDFDTTRAITSLLVNGAFDKYTDIKFVFCHSGGTMPVIVNRISEYFPSKTPDGTSPNGVRKEISNLYFDVAHAGYEPPLSALTKIVPVSHLMYGSDYPIFNPPVTIAPLSHYGFSAGDLQAINRGNAEKLFPRFKS